MTEEKETYKNSFIKTIEIQELLWSQITEKATLHLELISPMKAKVNTFKGTKYVTFLAQPLKSNKDPYITQGSTLLIKFPLLTWERAMYRIPLSAKKEWFKLKEDNISMTITKEGKKHVFIEEAVKKRVSEEQKKLAVKYYDE